MGKINTSTTDINGVTTATEVRTNRLEDFVIEVVHRVFGHTLEWKLVHAIERRKLRKQ